MAFCTMSCEDTTKSNGPKQPRFKESFQIIVLKEQNSAKNIQLFRWLFLKKSITEHHGSLERLMFFEFIYFHTWKNGVNTGAWKRFYRAASCLKTLFEFACMTQTWNWPFASWSTSSHHSLMVRCTLVENSVLHSIDDSRLILTDNFVLVLISSPNKRPIGPSGLL